MLECLSTARPLYAAPQRLVQLGLAFMQDRLYANRLLSATGIYEGPDVCAGQTQVPQHPQSDPRRAVRRESWWTAHA